MLRVSKKVIWMWLAEFLTKPLALAVLFFWFISGAAFLYLFGQDLDKIYKIGVVLDKWLFLGFSTVLAFLILSAVSSAFYKYWSLSYELGDTAVKVVKGFYEKKESYIP